MIGDRMSKMLSKIGIGRMEGQERQHGPVEILNVFGLGLVSASGIGFSFSDIRVGESFTFEFGFNLGNDCRWCLNAP